MCNADDAQRAPLQTVFRPECLLWRRSPSVGFPPALSLFQSLNGLYVGLGVRFALCDLVGRNDYRKNALHTQSTDERRYLPSQRSGSDSESHLRGNKLSHELPHPWKALDAFGGTTQQSFVLGLNEIGYEGGLNRASGFSEDLGKSVTIVVADVMPEIMLVVMAQSQGTQCFLEGLVMKWLRVHQDTVTIEDYRFQRK